VTRLLCCLLPLLLATGALLVDAGPAAADDPRISRIITILERMDQRIDGVERRLNTFDSRLRTLEGRYGMAPAPAAPGNPRAQVPAYGLPAAGGSSPNLSGTYGAISYAAQFLPDGHVWSTGLYQGVPYTPTYSPGEDLLYGTFNGQPYSYAGFLYGIQR